MQRHGGTVRAGIQCSAMNPAPKLMDAEHQSVMIKEVLEVLQCRPGDVIVDATLGLGGHARAILDKISPDGTLIGIDRDRESLEIARLRLKEYARSTRLFHDNFKNLPLVLNNLGTGPVDGILLDLGVSSYQLLSPERGFSFQSDAMLDMRMDQSQRATAADLVNSLEEDQLADVIYRYGEERYSRRIAAAIVAERQRGPITRSSQLAEIISRAVKARGYQRIHPATRTFQALRIAVNRELEGLEEFLFEAVSFLKPGGRIVVRKGLSPAEEFSVLAHELAHELLHRDEDEQLSRTVRETEAEALAFVLCQAIGLEAVNAAADYIQLYLGSKETLLESLQRIRETAAEIIGAITKKEPAEASGCEADRQGAEMGEPQVAHAA